MLTAGLTLATAALGILFLEVVLDHAIGMPLWLRRAIAWSGASGGGAYAVLRIALPLFGRVNVFYAAKTIEDADPSFKNSLTTYLDLRRRRGQVSRAAFEAVEARAVKDLVKVEIDGVIDRRRLLRLVYALSGLVVLSCLYAARPPGASSTRSAAPCSPTSPGPPAPVWSRSGPETSGSSRATTSRSRSRFGARPRPRDAPLQRQRGRR